MVLNKDFGRRIIMKSCQEQSMISRYAEARQRKLSLACWP